VVAHAMEWSNGGCATTVSSRDVHSERERAGGARENSSPRCKRRGGVLIAGEAVTGENSGDDGSSAQRRNGGVRLGHGWWRRLLLGLKGGMAHRGSPLYRHG
jgi:hypothetical protein